MAEFDLLGHLSVAVPMAPAGPRPRLTSAGSARVLAPRQKPPAPSRPHQPVSPPRPNTLIVDAPVPCNDWYNEQAALAKRNRESAARQRDLMFAKEENCTVPRDRGQGRLDATQKAALRETLKHEVELHQSQVRDARQRQRQLEQAQCSTYMAEAAEREAAERSARRSSSMALRADMQQRAEEARQRRTASSHSRYADPSGGYGLAIGERDLYPPPPEQVRAKQQDIVHTWQRQIEERRHRQLEAKSRDRMFAAEAAALAGATDNHERVQRQQARAAAHSAMAHADQQRQSRVNAEFAAKQRERQEAQRTAEIAAAEKANELEQKRSKQAMLRGDIDRMLSVRKQQAAHQRAASTAADRRRALSQAEAASASRTLLRCPATGRVLPPKCFNLPRNSAWNGASSNSSRGLF